MGNLSAANWRRINSSHYRAIRAALRDFKKRKKRTLLDQESRRSTPIQWSKYIVASTVIKLYNRSDSNVAILLRKSAYVNDRMPFRARFIDTSRLKIGRQAITSRIGPIFNEVAFNWIDPTISDDCIRTELKRIFFKYN
jgi:hypothetical protein